jgi:hypothetical protein
MRTKKQDYPGFATFELTAENDAEYLLLCMLVRALRREYESPPDPSARKKSTGPDGKHQDEATRSDSG